MSLLSPFRSTHTAPAGAGVTSQMEETVAAVKIVSLVAVVLTSASTLNRIGLKGQYIYIQCLGI